MDSIKQLRIGIDVSMTILTVIEMACKITGVLIHEWFGILLFLLFVVHNILNFKWYRSIFNGKYNLFRMVNTTINILLVILMTGVMISGMMISQHVFIFLNFGQDIIMAKRTHLTLAYWTYIFISLHIGLHWNIMAKSLRKSAKSKKVFLLLEIMSFAIFVYGIYVFFTREFLLKLSAKYLFDFFDYNQSVLGFFIDYIAVMLAFIFFSHKANKRIVK